MRALIPLLLLTLPATAQAKNDYAIFTVGYGGSVTRVDSADAVGHAPHLGFTVYGGDWFLELDFAPFNLASADVRLFPAVLGSVEVGVHLPGERGNLAITLVARTIDVGDAERGGRGFDGGVGVHYAFPAWGAFRFDPSLGAGVSILPGKPKHSGAWANGEVDVIAKLTTSLSLYVRAGIDLRTYASRDDGDAFDARAIRFGVGLALHDVLGIGHNDP